MFLFHYCLPKSRVACWLRASQQPLCEALILAPGALGELKGNKTAPDPPKKRKYCLKGPWFGYVEGVEAKNSGN
jgi:hypothetical protein